MDTERDDSPFVEAQGRQALTKNPLKDKRVREALTVGIDRDLLTKRVMDGAATPSSQPTAPDFGGYNEIRQFPCRSTTPTRAKKLLAEAGYPDGFSHDRPLHQRPLCQRREGLPGGRPDAVARRPEDVGRDAAALGVLPGGDQSQARRRATASCCSDGATPRPATPGFFPNILHSLQHRAKLGTWNLGHYSNPEVDKAIEARSRTHGPEGALCGGLAHAMKLAMEDHALIPLYTQSVIVATRKGLTYTTWANERTNRGLGRRQLNPQA